MKNFINFNKMVAPLVLQAVFWLGTLAFIVFGLIDIIHSRHYIIGFQLLILGPIALRIAIEMMILPFKIYHKLERLVQLKSA